MSSKAEELVASTDMRPVQGTVDVDIPIDVLWGFFRQANLWPRWNKCFTWVQNRDLVLSEQLIWAFEPIRKWYLYKMPAAAKIVEVEPGRKVTWEVTAFPGMYARHTYHMEDLGNGRTRFGSWEQGMGPGFKLTRWLWVPHFTFVKDRSLEGARFLEQVYKREGKLSEDALPKSKPGPAKYAAIGLPVVAAAVTAIMARRFYNTYLAQKVEQLGPGVYAVLNGGGNSLVVDGGSEVLVVDPKFPPFSNRLRTWIENNLSAPVTRLVNTHYHYDHSLGNELYPQAAIYAQSEAPHLMLTSDNEFSDPTWWRNHLEAVPRSHVRRRQRLKVGAQQVELLDTGPGHTQADLVVYLPEHEVVATGDIGWNGFRPFIDASKGGASPREWAQTLRRLVREHPDATFVPGHGPLANAADMLRFASYMETLCSAVEYAIDKGWSEDQAVERLDLSEWKLKRMPSFYRGEFQWATPERNIRTVYRIFTQRNRD
jgi:glyoxylase-like metal-dependent hydrolase (beta-lactamase superfamily II)